MDFQIRALPAAEFEHLYDLSDAELVAHQACRQIVKTKPGTPCRVSMQDAEVGETVILVNYEHLPAESPYCARHAVFVRQDAKPAQIAINEVPEVIRTRLISLRYYDAQHMMIDANVVEGTSVGEELSVAFKRPEIAYAHIHNAKPGCFAASAHRVKV
ncbi:DUF1203 domain-containing protein [Tropicimonas sp. S265A]|uniref:DUF1203 domain-containing protein n=1 Tax=Tropicimonas sp. S265A TaxID=3415134 RepID=UPI003C7C0C48